MSASKRKMNPNSLANLEQGKIEQIYDEPKTAQLNLKVTPSGKKSFAILAKAMGLILNPIVKTPL